MNSIQIDRRMLAGAVLAVGALLVWSTEMRAGITAANLRKTAPDFTLEDSKGALLKLSDYKGRVVLLDFWATWCGGCKIEIPWYMDFQNKYKEQGLSVLGVSMDEDGWKSVRPFLKENELNYPVVIGNEDLARAYGGLSSMPVTLLIDRDGKIAESHGGMVDKNTFEGDIRTLLQENAKNNVK